MSRSVKIFLSLLAYGFIAVCVFIGGTVYYYKSEYMKRGPLPYDSVFIVGRGDSAFRIASNLENSGLISSALVFKIAVHLNDVADVLRAGEYEISAGMSIKQILDLMIKGDIKQYKLTIPEGYTWHQALGVLKGKKELIGHAPNMIIEGTILPDTYYFVRNEDVNGILARMQSAMTTSVNKYWAGRVPDLPLRTTQDAVILASIVEKETGKPEERRRVAGLFINRLKKGMPLQSDPTVIYALTEGVIQNDGKGPLGRRLLRKDLEYDSPYNTYKYSGLPPSPICNPGLESIKAVLDPEQHNYIYMVADGTGGHAFAKTLREHNDNVAKWRKIRAAQ